ncbi:MAG: branched-chain amino acid ABC transporter permease [Thermodesulfobacteriota bacterium]
MRQAPAPPSVRIDYLKMMILFAAVAALPFGIPYMGGYVGLAIEMVIFAIFAIGFDLMLGYTGILSFGQAAYFGLAGYTMGLVCIHFKVPIFVGMLAGVVLGVLAAVVIGLLIIRKTGIYFAMLTIAFGQMFFFIASRWKDVTGGEDGLTGIPRTIFSLGPFSWNLQNDLSYYYFVFVFFVVATLAKYWLVRSHFGQVLKTIRENEVRAQMVGYNVRRYKLYSFIIGGAFAAVAGVLYAMFLRYMFPQTLDWIRSGNVVIMGLVGGMGTLFGPIVGAGLVTYLMNFTSYYTKYWQFIMGVIFVVFILFFPRGIWGFVERNRSGSR